MRPTTPRPLRMRLGAVALVAGVALAACGGASSTKASTGATPTTTAKGTPRSGSTKVLPVKDNPIHNTSTVQALKIDSVLVENNVDAAGKTTDDHLEIALSNTGSTDLAGFEVFYTFSDPTAHLTESYYTKLPDTFTIPAGGSRVVHFDNSGAPDHFPSNDFSLYKTSVNKLDVKVIVSAQGAAVQTTTLTKDAGGAETPD